MTKIVFFEDSYSENLKPLNYLNHTAKLKVGINRIYDKYSSLDEMPFFLSRNTALSFLNEKPDDEFLFLNSCLLPTTDLLKELKVISSNKPVYSLNRIAYVKCKYSEFKHLFQNEVDEPTTSLNLLLYPWDLLKYNTEQIQFDLTINSSKYKLKKNIHVSDNAEIHSSVVLDSSSGPIIISDNVKIAPFCYLKGPLFIGEQTEIKAHTQLTNSSVHKNCRISGEVSNSIVFDYSNKGHLGFIGHSIIGEWCNLGAGTTNSNLKNNYGKIKVDLFGKTVKTDEIFLGLIMGDHSKTAIGTLFNTGTICGVFANIFEDISKQKNIKSFSWGGKSSEKVNLDKLLETIPKYQSRRSIQFKENDATKIKQLYDTINDFE